MELRFEDRAQIQVSKQRVLLGGLSQKGVVDPEIRQSLYYLRLIGHRVLAGQELDQLIHQELVVTGGGYDPIGSCVAGRQGRDQSQGHGSEGTSYPTEGFGCIHRSHP